MLIECFRYEAAWEDAEKRVVVAAKSGKANPVVSVRMKTKRKAETEGEGRDEVEKVKSKKPKKEKRR